MTLGDLVALEDSQLIRIDATLFGAEVRMDIPCTSHSFIPVREIAGTQKQSAATGIATASSVAQARRLEADDCIAVHDGGVLDALCAGGSLGIGST